MSLVLIYNALKYGMPLLVGQVLILKLQYLLCTYTHTLNLLNWHVSRKLRLRTYIFLATLIFEMNIQIKVEHQRC